MATKKVALKAAPTKAPAVKPAKPATSAAETPKPNSKTADAQQAFAKLNSGKKIRRATWPEGQYLESKDGNVYHYVSKDRTDLYNSTAEDAAATDWE